MERNGRTLFINKKEEKDIKNNKDKARNDMKKKNAWIKNTKNLFSFFFNW